MPEPEMFQIVNTDIKLDASLHERLKALGQIKDRTPHWLMQTAIAEYVEREEAYEREKREDVERWERYQAIGNAIPNEAVDNWLASWGSEGELPAPDSLAIYPRNRFDRLIGDVPKFQYFEPCIPPKSDFV